ncbi:MAG: DUF2807 domain-containing protein [Phycisphaerales bacterium]|nr:DUF2807 domain-containing protein [Phycisphaerales bacterium]
MNRKSLAVSLVASGLLVGCVSVPGSGVSMTERRTVAEFNEIELRGIGTIELGIGTPTDLEVSGDDNIVPLIKTEVINKRLTISAEKSVRPTVALVIRGTTANIIAASCSGAGDIRISGVNNTDKVRLVISGAGDLTFSGTVGGIEAIVSGAGDIRLSGSTNSADYLVSGAGDIHATDMITKSAKARVSGAGDVTLNAGESADMAVSGAGDIRYCGDATNVVSKVSGAGTVRKMK